jgi:uncharacterized protein (TIGR00299 family) protein
MILYLDLAGGISGDMTVAALAGLGVPIEVLRDALAAVPLGEVEIALRQETRHQIAGLRFEARHRAGAPADVGVAQGAPSGAAARAVARVAGGAVEHAHRPYRDIRSLLDASTLAPAVRDMAQRVFRVLAEAEGAVHGIAPDDVEFHEVGAWDAIADVVCTAAALAHLSPSAVYCSPVPLGGGTVRTAHGVMPVPAPATLHLLRGFTVTQGGPAFERTTPTGAAILAALARPAPQPFTFTPERIGTGLGTADPPEVPNLLRAVLGREDARAGSETIELAAANLDDANPEWIGYAMERLLAAGALDVALLPLQMKKNRPGTQIQVLYPPGLRDAMLGILFGETGTLGVRFQAWERVALPRRAHAVRTRWGEVAGKVAEFAGRERFAPEFEACRAIAQRENVPLPEVYRAAQRAWEDERGREA